MLATTVLVHRLRPELAPPNMAVENVTGIEGQQSTFIPYTDLSFDIHNADSSVLKLVFWIRPKWRECFQELKIVKFTEGITNTVSMPIRAEHVPCSPIAAAQGRTTQT